MFGFGKKKEEKEIEVVKSEIINEYCYEYLIKGIHLADGYSHWRDGVKEGGPSHYTTKCGWSEVGNPTKIRIYFLYEENDGGLGFLYGTWEWKNNKWKDDDTLSKVKFHDGPSKIVYKNVNYLDSYSDGSKKERFESTLAEILLSRGTPLPMG